MNNYLLKLISISKQNKYTKIYQFIIERALSRVSAASKSKYTLRKEAIQKLNCCVEGHHIFPRSLCNSFEEQNDIHNYAFLTFKEHLLCHKLLATRMIDSTPINCAFYAMFTRRNTQQQHKLMTLREAEWFKQNSMQSWSRPGKENGMFGRKQTEATKLKISEKAKGRKPTNIARKLMSDSHLERREENAWNQLIKNPIYQKFSDYNNFLSEIRQVYESCHKLPLLIARSIGATEGGVKTALKAQKLEYIVDQRFSKLIKNYGDRFKSFSEYENMILYLHNKGMGPFQIANELAINGSGVLSVLKNKEIIPHRAKTGPKKK